LETDGLAAAFTKYIRTDVFSEAFQMYVDKTMPDLKQIAEETGDLTTRYCQTIKEKAVKTAGWLWNKDDYSEVFSCVLREYQVIKELKPLLKISGFVSYQNTLQHLLTAVNKSKVPETIIVRQFPTMDSFFACLAREGDITQMILPILQSNKETIQTLFFDPMNLLQTDILYDCLGNELPINKDAFKEIYHSLPNGIGEDESTFIQQVRSIIQEYFAKSLAVQIKNLWKEKTQTDSPNDWTTQNHLSAKMLFVDNPETAREIQTIIEKPLEFSSPKLKTIQEKLQDWKPPEIDDVQRKLVTAEQKIDAMSGDDAKNILRKMLQKESDLLLEILEVR
jgi:hypothetical protein